MSAAHLDKPVAVVVDGKVISAPVVKAKLGGSILITGQFTAEEAKALAKAIGGK